MSMTDFSYDMASDAAGIPSRIAVYADERGKRSEILGDLAGAGFRTIDGGALAALLEGPIALLGDVVMVDCPLLDAEHLAALARLDMRVAQSGAKLIVATSMDALDDVFGSLDQSEPQILVAPSRADRIVAVGRVMAGIANPGVREMSEEDRLSLLHLSQQVEAIASKLEGLSESAQSRRPQDQEGRDRLSLGDSAGRNAGAPRLVNASRPGLPDPRHVRRIIAGRQARARFFDEALFADPAWDMLLDLTAAHGEGQQVSVTSLCIAAGVPATTALRWLKQMVESGIFERIADESDRRRAFIALSESSLEAMSRYFNEVDVPLAQAA